MRRLHFAPLAAGEVVLVEADHRYVARVLRLRAGDRLMLFDGEGREADAVIRGIDEGRVVLEVDPPRDAAGPPALELTLIACLLKGDKMELVVQKATELGVTRIVPAAAERSVVRLERERASGRVARWRKIAQEAARQCGRADTPRLEEPVALAAALGESRSAAFRVLFHEGERGRPLRQVMPDARPVSAVAAVGPEGGFTPEEVAAAHALGFVSCGLGPRVLRAETAAIAAVTLLAHTWGDLA